MTREKAIEVAAAAYAGALPRGHVLLPNTMEPLVAAFEALGLIEFDPPSPAPEVSALDGMVLGLHEVQQMRFHGYRLTRRGAEGIILMLGQHGFKVVKK